MLITGLLRKKLLLLAQSAYLMTVLHGLLILLMAPAISYIGKYTEIKNVFIIFSYPALIRHNVLYPVYPNKACLHIY